MKKLYMVQVVAEDDGEYAIYTVAAFRSQGSAEQYAYDLATNKTGIRFVNPDLWATMQGHLVADSNMTFYVEEYTVPLY